MLRGARLAFIGCLTFLVRGQKYFLVDVDRVRLDYPKLKRRVISNKERLEADTVLIEDAALGTALIQQLRHEGSLLPIRIQKPKDGKLVRMEAQSHVIERGSLILPKHAPWLEDFLGELLAFPAVRHDDQVDALSQFLVWVNRARRELAEGIASPVLFVGDGSGELREVRG